MSRMNYGPRFRGTGLAEVKVGYDEALDSRTWKGWKPRPFSEMTPLKQDISRTKRSNTMRGKRGDYSLLEKGPPPETYTDVATRCAQRVADAIALLDGVLDELNAAPGKKSSERTFVERIAVMDAIKKLRIATGTHRP